MSLTVGPISFEEHLEFLRERPASFLQTPSWANGMPGWTGERVGWFSGDGDLVGVALVMMRALPVVRRSFAWVPEGPVLDWSELTLGEWLDPLVEHLRGRGAFAVRLSPPQAVRRWHAETVKAAVGPGRRLGDVPPDEVDGAAERLVKDLVAAGWTRGRGGPSWSRFTFFIPLAGRSIEDLRAGFSKTWRRGIGRATRAGVEVSRGGYDDLAEFYRVYLATAARDGFDPQPIEHFQGMFRALSAEGPDRIRLYLSRHDGEVLAGMLIAVVGGLAGAIYGASSDSGRELSPTQAIDWQVMHELLAEGVGTYDLRGVSDSLDPEDPMFGMLRFKLGAGGVTVEQVGDWDLALSPLWHRLFTGYTLGREVAVPRLRGWGRAAGERVRHRRRSAA
jgi:lipid II:glycine glycyltransferase (peptidoglycan interpeptide bridge formation enzyme)